MKSLISISQREIIQQGQLEIFIVFKLAKIIAIILCIGGISFLISQNYLLGLLVSLGLVLGSLLVLDLKWGLILVILSLILGQLVRIPLPGLEKELLPNDIIIPAMILIWLWGKLINKKIEIKENPINLSLFLFLGIAMVSLIWGSRNLVGREIVVSALYLGRFIEYALLFYLILDLVKNRKEIIKYIKFIFIAALILAVLGFGQYIFIPNFSFLAGRAGWDPHASRLLSTWFDPNFMGGFFVFILSFILAFSLFSKSKRNKIWLGIGGLILFAALILTYSRSAFLALVVVIFVLGILKSRKLLVGGFLALLILVALTPRLQARLAGATTIDVTARHRITSWLNTLEIIKDHLFLGVGFNAFRYAQLEYGTIGFTSSHSDFGSDSSFLTILATTGILGFLAYLWLLGAMFYLAFRTFREKQNDALGQALGLGMLAGLSGLIIHSQFTNSLLYPHFMEVIWIFLGLILISEKCKAKSVKPQRKA